MTIKRNEMKMPFFIWKRLMGFFVLVIFLMACTDKEEGTATLQVRLTDAPANYDEVNIDIQGVEVHNDSGDQPSGWRTLIVEDGVYNLLELSNGMDTLLAHNELPAGMVSQIRLILGPNNTVVVDGVAYPLATPSAQQSGLKLNVNAALVAGITYTILLDFDAAQSVIQTGNGSYKLKPVIRAISEATSGAIQGTVMPFLADPVVYVIQNTDTVATAYTNELGNFLVRGVPAGMYKVSFDPKEGYAPTAIEDVNVTIGNITNLGTVTIL